MTNSKLEIASFRANPSLFPSPRILAFPISYHPAPSSSSRTHLVALEKIKVVCCGFVARLTKLVEIDFGQRRNAGELCGSVKSRQGTERRCLGVLDWPAAQNKNTVKVLSPSGKLVRPIVTPFVKRILTSKMYKQQSS